MALDRRLTRLRALVDRIERLPASPRREWMLQEARARVVDIETGVEPRPMRMLDEEPPAPPPEPPASGGSNGRAAKRRRPKPAPVAAPRARPHPEVPARQVPPPVSETAPARIEGSDPNAAMLGDDEVLWLEDQADHTVTEPGDGSTGTAPWRRGLRG
jgi:hypothetical protein